MFAVACVVAVELPPPPEPVVCSQLAANAAAVMGPVKVARTVLPACVTVTEVRAAGGLGKGEAARGQSSSRVAADLGYARGNNEDVRGDDGGSVGQVEDESGDLCDGGWGDALDSDSHGQA